MERDDLNKLIRIRDAVSELSNLAIKLEASDHRIRGATDQYRKYHDLVHPIILRNNKYLLEFQALYDTHTLSFSYITPALVAFKSFLNGVIKQETLGSQTAFEEIKNELFIDENKPFAAYKAVTDIVNRTTSSLKMVDNYLESTSLDFFSGVNTKAQVNILTKHLKPNAQNFKIALNRFLTEWGGNSIEIKTTTFFHDRYIIIDDIEVWHLGPSLNHLGVKPAMVSKLQDQEIAKHILFLFDTQWSVASSI